MNSRKHPGGLGGAGMETNVIKKHKKKLALVAPITKGIAPKMLRRYSQPVLAKGEPRPSQAQARATLKQATAQQS